MEGLDFLAQLGPRAAALLQTVKPPPFPAGRCKLHGGKSTGPRTPEGKARSAAAAVGNLELARAALARKRSGTAAPEIASARAALLALLRSRGAAPAAPLPPRPLTVEEKRAADAAEHHAAIAAGRPSPFKWRDNAGNWIR